MFLSDLAAKIRDAYDCEAILPVRDFFSSQEQAYEVQEINTKYWLDDGRQLVGRKIGLTASVVQQQLGVDEPDFGMLFDDMLIAESGLVAYSGLIQPKVEAELAFVMAESLDAPNISVSDVIAATDYIVPALEIVDSRVKNWDINIYDTIADNASSALFVLGPARTKLSELDLPSVAMSMFEGDRLVSQGLGEDCLGSPLNSMLWLARKMVEIGRPLKAGDIVLSGALGKMVAVTSPGHYRADFKNVGSVAVTFE